MNTEEYGTTLNQLSKLQSDWDSYGAEPPSMKAIDTYKNVLSLLARTFPPKITTASAEGGISLFFVTGDPTVYVEINNDGTYSLVSFHDGTLEIEDEVSPDELASHIKARCLQ